MFISNFISCLHDDEIRVIYFISIKANGVLEPPRTFVWKKYESLKLAKTL